MARTEHPVQRLRCAGGGLGRTLAQDVRYAARLLRRNPVSSAVAIVTLALGIGATTAMFSVVYGVLLRPLPYPRPERIVELAEVAADGHRMHFADPNFADVRAQSRSLAGVAEYTTELQAVAAAGGDAARVTVAWVSQDFPAVMGVRPALGRAFAAEDQRRGAAPVALVSDSYWRQGLGGATNLGRLRLTVGQQPVAVAGVLPPGFAFPDDAAVWMPRELEAAPVSRTAHNWRVVARLRPGATLVQARAELSGIARQLKRQYGRDIDMVDLSVAPLRDALTRDVRSALLILLGAAGSLLLIACANVVNLLLAQLAARAGELALRAALGAGRWRLAGQLFTEALLLSLAGGALGVLVAVWGVAALVASAPGELPRLGDVAVSLPVLGFSLGLAVAVAAALGLLTARRATAGALHDALAEGGRGQSGAPARQRLGRAIVAAQLAMTMILLVGAGLLGRSLQHVLDVDPGFHTERVVVTSLALPDIASDDDARRRVRFLDELLDAARALPGVRAAGGSNSLPLSGGLANGTFAVMPAGQPPPRMEDLEQLFHDSTRTGDAAYCVTSPGYFQALGIPLLRGRLLDQRDTPAAPHAAVISQALARARWPNQDPLGQTVEFGNMDGELRLLTVVGVVGDIRDRSLEAPPPPIIFVDYRQRPRATSTFDVVLRTAGDPAALPPAVRAIVHRLDPTLPPSFNTFTAVVGRSLAARRFNMILVGLFAATALLLALIGIYGVMSYAVTRRTREVGIRMALGAQTGDVLRLILAQEVRTTLAGVAVGIAGALALTRFMRSLLFGVSPSDPLTFAAVALLLVAVALFASFVPARRATAVDPLHALRSE
jgi:putative ABC transport system permease protein